MCAAVICSKKFLTKFIEIYKDHPALWKVKSKEYSNKQAKNKAYNALIEYCKLYYPDADREFVYKKIQNLRGCFRKELKKVEASQRSRDVTDLYEPRLWYFNLLLFTTDQETPLENIDNENFMGESNDFIENEDFKLEEEESFSENTDDFLDSSSQLNDMKNIAGEIQDDSYVKLEGDSNEPATATHQVNLLISNSEHRKRKYWSDQQQEDFTKPCIEVLQPKETIDEFQAIGINVASKLRKMESTQQVLAEGLINKILLKGLFKELTRTSDILDSFIGSSSN
ncbi:hypothetical protein ABEB36_012627 [Hypothenemus hampei]|uniref:MADF domain-containing protein n=1 Tax=Hypothenemus hampei TaxID=57062 RepID=A0ABD1EEL9_HYPHA